MQCDAKMDSKLLPVPFCCSCLSKSSYICWGHKSKPKTVSVLWCECCFCFTSMRRTNTLYNPIWFPYLDPDISSGFSWRHFDAPANWKIAIKSLFRLVMFTGLLSSTYCISCWGNRYRQWQMWIYSKSVQLLDQSKTWTAFFFLRLQGPLCRRITMFVWRVTEYTPIIKISSSAVIQARQAPWMLTLTTNRCSHEHVEGFIVWKVSIHIKAKTKHESTFFNVSRKSTL